MTKKFTISICIAGISLLLLSLTTSAQGQIPTGIVPDTATAQTITPTVLY